MKVYLVCILDSDNYCDPQFYFFETFNEAHKYVKDLILFDLQEENMLLPGEAKIECSHQNGDCSDDQIMRIDYSLGSDVFYVHTIHELEINDEDYLCIFHHAYEGVGFYVEKIGSLEECQKQMKKSAIQSAEDFDVNMNDSGFFEITDRNSCVDIDIEWHMCDIIQFKASEICRATIKNVKKLDPNESVTTVSEEKSNNNDHKYDDEIYEELKDYMYGPLPEYGFNPDHVETSLEEAIKDIDSRPKHEIFKNLCNCHGIAPSTVEYLYESIWGKPKDKTVGYFLEKKSIN